jgi:hypothetical protein
VQYRCPERIKESRTGVSTVRADIARLQYKQILNAANTVEQLQQECFEVYTVANTWQFMKIGTVFNQTIANCLPEFMANKAHDKTSSVFLEIHCLIDALTPRVTPKLP